VADTKQQQTQRQHIEIFLSMHYINLHFTYLLTYMPGTDRQRERNIHQIRCSAQTAHAG